MENDILSVPRHQYQQWCQQLNHNERSSSTKPSSATNSVTNRSVDQLPPEILLEILSYLTNQQYALRAVSLVCRKWLFCAIPLLYKHVKISNTYHWAIYLMALRREKRFFPYGSFAKSIDLSCCSISEPLKSDNQRASSFSRPTTTTTSTVVSLSAPLHPTNTDHDTTHDTIHNGIRRRLSSTSLKDENNSDPQPTIFISTSSLIQLAHACPNLVSLNLSHTKIFNDILVVETGEYVSTIQHNAIQPGLTHLPVDITPAIRFIGRQCPQLQQLKLQNCQWVSAYVIWLWVDLCPSITYLDARDTKCTIHRLTSDILQVQQQQTPQPPHSQNDSLPSSLPLSSSTTSSTPSSSSSSSSSTSLTTYPTPKSQMLMKLNILEETTNGLAALDLADSSSNHSNHQQSGSGSLVSSTAEVMENGNVQNRQGTTANINQRMESSRQQQFDVNRQQTSSPLLEWISLGPNLTPTTTEITLPTLYATATSTPPTSAPVSVSAQAIGIRQENHPDHVSTTSSTTEQKATTDLWNQPLCHYVFTILKEAKHEGSLELSWLLE
ncbi:unnamed protein product [Absidia cylindrospora]